MLPLRTDRLVVRMMRDADLERFLAYRNDPELARLQDWPLPYTRERAEQLIAGQAPLEGPTDGACVQLALEHGGELVGDLAVFLRSGGAIAGVGYTLMTEHQGRGFAREALAAVVDALIEHGVHRFEAELDDQNVPSMRLLEQTGFTMECLARKTSQIRGEWVDDLRYSMLADERRAWRDRVRTPPAEVRLVDITPDDAPYWAKLATHHSQQQLVAPMLLSFRDALFPEVVDGTPVVPWMRGIEADGERTGFVMLCDRTDAHPEPYLWRLLIDRWHQRRGIGERALALVFDRLRQQGCESLTVSWVDGPGSPRPFYERLGFAPTGDIEDGEIVARLMMA